jgi:hypothetical protein
MIEPSAMVFERSPIAWDCCANLSSNVEKGAERSPEHRTLSPLPNSVGHDKEHRARHTASGAFKWSAFHLASRVHTTTSPSRPSVAGRTTIHLAPTATSLNRPLRKASSKSLQALSRSESLMFGSLLPIPAATDSMSIGGEFRKAATPHCERL